ncbi:MAG: S41 family peptidase [Bacteroidales bacterium]|jgi:Tol biopolymer transport system component/C-terminal processing protease CtpA/Prc|nr:S41 family peptidase [Bacteroidales bacterium]
MKKLLIISMVSMMTVSAFGQNNPLWLRYTAISPDGKTILFTYKGDIYSVPSDGGTAVPLTISESYEFSPRWSRDGKRIAFASDRYGNFDVFVIPSSGGEGKRLTFYSGNELPCSFTADNNAVLFSAYRQDLASNAQFPVSLISELYSVPVTGGKVSMVLPTPALDASINTTGDKLIFHDIKGYENIWRKHHTSSITHDIWVYDLREQKYSKLTQFNGEDRNPVFDSNNNDFYYLSEQNGSFNVFKSSLADPSKNEPLTSFTNNPVRFLSLASDNTLCFSYDGEVYTLKPGNSPKKIDIIISNDGRTPVEKYVPVSEYFSEAKLSPTGKEFAYVCRGEIFVTSMEGGITKRITNTPWQERSVSFSPDGRTLVYAAEKDNNWNVYTKAIIRKEEPYFYVSTVLKEEPVIASAAEEYQPVFSPDGKEVAYLENRVVLRVVNLASKQVRTIMTADKNYSYRDGDQYYSWSPDGKWFLVQFGYPERLFSTEVGLVASDGKSEIHNLTLSGYDDFAPKWVMDGKVMIWGSNREGARQQSGDPVTGDVYALFFSKESFDRFNLTKEEFALLKEKEAKDEKEKKETEEKAKSADKKGKKTPEAKTEKDSLKKEIVIDWTNLTERKNRLTIHTSDASDWVLSKDGEKLYYLTRFDKGNDLWVTELRTKETKLLAKLGVNNASMELSPSGKFIFLLANGKTMKIETESGKNEPLKVSGEMLINEIAEKNYIFDHTWRQLKQKFYVEDLHGIDWDFYYRTYKKFLPFINNNYDFAEMLSEMLGELNASHTGSGYRFDKPNSDKTATLGLFYDYNYTGKGLNIAEVIEGGPVDKASSKIKAGTIIEKIDEQSVDSIDFYQLLNRKNDNLTLLSVYDPSANKRWEESVKPASLSEENELLYKRWVKNRRLEVEKLSEGKIGYVHVRAMNDASMRTVFEEALGRNIGKEAIIVDTRFNGGGNIHEQLSDFLSGKKYIDIIPHGQSVGYEPYDKWIKPSIVLIGESNYSDAHLFPVAYKLKGVGKTLGMPIPGTGTFVWWETQIDPTLYFGMPMGGWRTPDGKFCENNQMEPDIRVINNPDMLSSGHDQQIEAAVLELLKK